MFTRIYRSFHTDDVYCSAFTLTKIKLQKSKVTKVKPQVSGRSQYRVWPPTAPMQSLYLPLIDRTRFLKNSFGISFHFCTRMSASSARVSSCGPLWTRRPSSSQVCPEKELATASLRCWLPPSWRPQHEKCVPGP